MISPWIRIITASFFAVRKLDQLMAIRDAEFDKELLAAFHKSGLSHQDAIDLLAKKKSEEDVDSEER